MSLSCLRCLDTEWYSQDRIVLHPTAPRMKGIPDSGQAALWVGCFWGFCVRLPSSCSTLVRRKLRLSCGQRNVEKERNREADTESLWEERIFPQAFKAFGFYWSGLDHAHLLFLGVFYCIRIDTLKYFKITTWVWHMYTHETITAIRTSFRLAFCGHSFLLLHLRASLTSCISLYTSSHSLVSYECNCTACVEVFFNLPAPPFRKSVFHLMRCHRWLLFLLRGFFSKSEDSAWLRLAHRRSSPVFPLETRLSFYRMSV